MYNVLSSTTCNLQRSCLHACFQNLLNLHIDGEKKFGPFRTHELVEHGLSGVPHQICKHHTLFTEFVAPTQSSSGQYTKINVNTLGSDFSHKTHNALIRMCYHAHPLPFSKDNFRFLCPHLSAYRWHCKSVTYLQTERCTRSNSSPSLFPSKGNVEEWSQELLPWPRTADSSDSAEEDWCRNLIKEVSQPSRISTFLILITVIIQCNGMSWWPISFQPTAHSPNPWVKVSSRQSDGWLLKNNQSLPRYHTQQ